MLVYIICIYSLCNICVCVLYVCIHVCMYVCMYVRMYVCMYHIAGFCCEEFNLTIGSNHNLKCVTIFIRDNLQFMHVCMQK